MINKLLLAVRIREVCLASRLKPVPYHAMQLISGTYVAMPVYIVKVGRENFSTTDSEVSH